MSAASNARQGVALILRLYREVLRLHRERLPPPMRDLGDSYARAEFRSHLRGKTTQPQWQEFVKEWQTYVATLQGDAHAATDAEASVERVLTQSSDEQRKRLEQLQRELTAQSKDGPPTNG
jgi:hypothetical protein